VGKIADKAVYRSVFLTTWHSILSAELTKTRRNMAILPTGFPLAWISIYCLLFLLVYTPTQLSHLHNSHTYCTIKKETHQKESLTHKEKLFKK